MNNKQVSAPVAGHANIKKADSEHFPLSGACHCQRVRFRCRKPAPPEIIACNCSRCQQSGFLHVLVPHAGFQLQHGESAIAEYRFNTHTARHWFCACCGISPFYQPRSHPNHFSVNARCLDTLEWHSWPVIHFDGQRWEENINLIRSDQP